jgi:formylglycine-generating enzyme required for sulfatase activity
VTPMLLLRLTSVEVCVKKFAIAVLFVQTCVAAPAQSTSGGTKIDAAQGLASAQEIMGFAPSKINVPAGVLPAMKVNSKDGLTYIWIPAGAFTMGCSTGDNECFDDERPAHKVTITKGFWIGQTLVTQAAYKRVAGTNPSRFKGEQLPVEMVSWYDAQRYCRTIGMRLATEAEWEYAARAGNTGARYGELDAIAWYAGNSGPQLVDGTTLYRSDPKNYEAILIAKGNQTHPVGQKQANAWHLYDMIGNVWEWTADWGDKTYYAHSEARDPKGPLKWDAARIARRRLGRQCEK